MEGRCSLEDEGSLGVVRKDNTHLSICITHYMLLSGFYLYFWELIGYVLATNEAKDLVN